MSVAERQLNIGVFVRFALLIAVVITFLDTHAVFGQASEAEMRSFPMPPPSGYHATKTFGYVGDYGYYTAPASSRYSTGIGAADYTYVRYLGVAGKRVYLYGAWGPNTPPPPSGGGDACPHSHVSYGVWARYVVAFPWLPFSWLPFPLIDIWIFVGGGGMSGDRDAGGRCVHRTDTSLGEFDPRFGWGDEFEVFDLRATPFIRELVVGVLSNTHGWGTCTLPPGESFRACREPSYIIGYTLP